MPRLRRVPVAARAGVIACPECGSSLVRRTGGRGGRRAGAALVGLTAALVLVGLASGCGGDDEDGGRVGRCRADPGLALTQSAAALREKGTFTFEASFTRVKATAPDDVQEYATAKGVISISARAPAGAELDLADILPERAARIRFDEPVTVAMGGRLDHGHARWSDSDARRARAHAGRRRARSRATRTRSSRSTTCSRSRCGRGSSTATAAPRTTPSRTTRRRPAGWASRPS